MTAPLLRPNVAPEHQVDHLPGNDGHNPLPNLMIDAKVHDPKILPHMYDHEVPEEMLPLIEAPVEMANDQDWTPGDCFWDQQSGDVSVDTRRRIRTAQPERRRGFLRE